VRLGNLKVRNRFSEDTKEYKKEGLISVDRDQIHKLEAGEKNTNFYQHMNFIGRPGISDIFPSNPPKYTRSTISLKDYHNELIELNELLYSLECSITDCKKLGPTYSSRFMHFETPTFSSLPKYPICKESEYIRKIQNRMKKRAINFISSEGINMTFRMWRTSTKLIRSFLDLHSMTQTGDFNCNILWTMIIESNDIFHNLNDFQYINHFPNSKYISDKKHLFLEYSQMRAKFGDEFAYHPHSYCFPEEYEEFIASMEEWKRKGDKRADIKWIFKPSSTCSGFGIFVFDAHNWMKTKLRYHWMRYLEDKNKKKDVKVRFGLKLCYIEH
jgi:hypothetical protein